MSDPRPADCTSMFGHKFVARYSVKETEPSVGVVFWSSTLQVKPIEQRTYMGDVCTRCGVVVNQPTKVRANG